MIKLKIKCLSLNQAYSGRRFATDELEAYKLEISLLAPKLLVPDDFRLEAEYEFGVSQKNIDVDNQIKAFQDTLADIYGFNDNRIYKIVASKVDVPKGKEYIAFNIKKL
jgi:Holliday junction resolvase RusA-like endonuclease